jgi:hypothetical protein
MFRICIPLNSCSVDISVTPVDFFSIAASSGAIL